MRKPLVYLLRKTVKTVEEALKGASDILAEEVSRAQLRAPADYLAGCSPRGLKMIIQEGSKFEMYRDFKIRVKDIAPHNMLGCSG